MRRHVLAPGGLETVCGWATTALVAKRETAGHSLAGHLCVECRAKLKAYPGLLNAIIAELREDGLPIEVRPLGFTGGSLKNMPVHLGPKAKPRAREDDPRQGSLF